MIAYKCDKCKNFFSSKPQMDISIVELQKSGEYEPLYIENENWKTEGNLHLCSGCAYWLIKTFSEASK